MRRVHFQELECSSARTMISENLPRRPHGTCHIVSLRYSGLGDRRDTLTNNYRGAGRSWSAGRVSRAGCVFGIQRRHRESTQESLIGQTSSCEGPRVSSAFVEHEDFQNRSWIVVTDSFILVCGSQRITRVCYFGYSDGIDLSSSFRTCSSADRVQRLTGTISWRCKIDQLPRKSISVQKTVVYR